MIKNKPRILVFDIETSPCIALVWGCGKQYVGHDQIMKDFNVMTISYMWLEDKKPTVISYDLNKTNISSFDDKSDLRLLKKFSEIYNKADVVVAHNGSRFDVQKLQARLFTLGLPPLAPVLVDDTYQMLRHIGLTNKKLDYVTKRTLGVKGKTKVDFSLWVDIAWNKSKKALDKMIKYNMNDVVILKKAYLRITQFSKSKYNMCLGSVNHRCPACGSDKLLSRGYRYALTHKYRRYQCKACHRWCSDSSGYIERSLTKPL